MCLFIDDQSKVYQSGNELRGGSVIGRESILQSRSFDLYFVVGASGNVQCC
jgi:hypothetical protein